MRCVSEHWNIVEDFAGGVREWPPEQRLQLFVELAEHDSTGDAALAAQSRTGGERI